jgi:hypothetical protein
MQFIQAKPAAQLVQALEALEANQAVAQPINQQPFVATEYVPLTMEDLKRRAVQATEESQADKGIDHTLFTCGKCATIWRSKGFTLCPTCAGHVGDILFLDYDQRGDLHDAAWDQKEVRSSYTCEGLGRALDEFRALLEEYAPWYDRTNRKLIQACHGDLCRAGGTSSKVALAIHFFKEEWVRASDDEKTFCPEVIQQ